MTTNTQIQEAIFEMVSVYAAGIPLPISYPGVNFEQPNGGEWLELVFLPNDYAGSQINTNGATLPRGIFRINACDSRKEGLKDATERAEAVKAAFPIRAAIVEQVAVSKVPVLGMPMIDAGVIRIPVTIEYHG